jgi:hypothetical protein
MKARHTEQFGEIAHVWSIYQPHHNRDDSEPFTRGIKSIQLFSDEKGSALTCPVD